MPFMEESTGNFRHLSMTWKRFARRLLIIGENRLELIALEVQEGRERLLHAVLLALGVAAFGLLAGLTFTAAIVVLFWPWPVAVLLIMTGLHGAVGICLYRRLAGRVRDWHAFSASLDQLQKDRACLERILA
jgi:uncharacterized membrane protein YqjE